MSTNAIRTRKSKLNNCGFVDSGYFIKALKCLKFNSTRKKKCGISGGGFQSGRRNGRTKCAKDFNNIPRTLSYQTLRHYKQYITQSEYVPDLRDGCIKYNKIAKDFCHKNLRPQSQKINYIQYFKIRSSSFSVLQHDCI